MVLRGTLTKNETNSHMSLIYGGIAGCIARTIVAPMDKIKIVTSLFIAKPRNNRRIYLLLT